MHHHTDNKSLNDIDISRIDRGLYDFIEAEILPLTSIESRTFWRGFLQIIDDLTPTNQALLSVRNDLQAKIDQWHLARPDGFNGDEYQTFLQNIGYLTPKGPDFSITTKNVDDEIATLAGPQLVVPVKNARFALNAANARWGSLYDALYGSDVIPYTEKLAPTEEYNIARGDAVVAYAQTFLDENFPLKMGSHKDVSTYLIKDGQVSVMFTSGETTGLGNLQQFVALKGSHSEPTEIVLKNNGLHIILQLLPESQRANHHNSVIKDIVIEAALSTIMDCEDSVAAVDPQDKLEVYRNWLGLNKGDLATSFKKGTQTVMRALAQDRNYTTVANESYLLHGRSLMLVRNVGHLMTTSLMTDSNKEDAFEGIVDGVITSLIATIDLNKQGHFRNSRAGSIYIVKPKMHGPEEVAFACTLFTRIEQLLGLAPNTIKIGIMDEERRTTVNLKECIRAAKARVFFINTGFLDRTGDEIHTSMQAGAFLPKSKIKAQPWISAYEDWNVDIGLACGFTGKAQIGKGMFAMPDEMANMMEQKLAHPRAGANTAWVPSPTAATLHAMHYHQVDVFATQADLAQRSHAKLSDILTIPLMDNSTILSSQEIKSELENNAQGILGYVVRWIDQGIGCSKVPDINGIGLMEDRATLRISSQHIANWLQHNICSRGQVEEVLQRMAKVVDQQNAHDEHYQNMAPLFIHSIAFQAAQSLVFEGTTQPNGYTEPLLHAFRRQRKSM